MTAAVQGILEAAMHEKLYGGEALIRRSAPDRPLRKGAPATLSLRFSVMPSRAAHLAESLDRRFVGDAPKLSATVTAGVPGKTLGEVSESNRLEAVFEFGNDTQEMLLEPVQVQAWGHALGTLHAASESYQPVPVRLSSGMVQFPESFSLIKFWTNIKAVCSSDPDLQRVHAELGTWLESLPTSEMIVTHGDFRSGNAIWDGGRVTILDFDEPVLAWAEYDVARTLLQDECDPFPNLELHLKNFLEGYEGARALPNVQSRISNFVRVRALLMHAWSLEDSTWGNEAGLMLLRNIATHGLEWRKP